MSAARYPAIERIVTSTNARVPQGPKTTVAVSTRAAVECGRAAPSTPCDTSCSPTYNAATSVSVRKTARGTVRCGFITSPLMPSPVSIPMKTKNSIHGALADCRERRQCPPTKVWAMDREDPGRDQEHECPELHQAESHREAGTGAGAADVYGGQHRVDRREKRQPRRGPAERGPETAERVGQEVDRNAALETTEFAAHSNVPAMPPATGPSETRAYAYRPPALDTRRPTSAKHRPTRPMRTAHTR